MLGACETALHREARREKMLRRSRSNKDQLRYSCFDSMIYPMTKRVMAFDRQAKVNRHCGFDKSESWGELDR